MKSGIKLWLSSLGRGQEGTGDKMSTEATGIEGIENGVNCLDQQYAECLTGCWFEVSWCQMAF